MDEFNREAYASGLAALLPGISADEIVLDVTAASILVSATVVSPSAEVASAAFAVLEDLDATTLSEALGVTIAVGVHERRTCFDADAGWTGVQLYRV